MISVPSVLLAAGGAFLLSCLVTGQLVWARFTGRSLDQPCHRSLHHVPRPRTGGIAILSGLGAGLVAGLVYDAWTDGSTPPGLALASLRETSAVVVSTLLLAVVSFWDDVHNLPAGRKFAFQVVAAIGVVYGGQIAFDAFDLPLLGSLPLGWSAKPMAVLFVLWMTNLYNFMDGIDGLAAGMAVIGFGLLGGFAFAHGDMVVGAMAIVVAASSAGFLTWNFPPSRIFMGDVGSAPLGFLAAVLTLTMHKTGTADIGTSVILFSPFIVDATAVVLRRAACGEKVWEAHREHYYQRLVLAGWSHRRTTLVEYGLMAVCGGLAFVWWRGSGPERLAVLVAVVGIFVLLAFAVGAVERRSYQLGLESARRQAVLRGEA